MGWLIEDFTYKESKDSKKTLLSVDMGVPEIDRIKLT